ncbi:MAG: DUF1501 domain-containing protein [Terriglobales bacterium]
MTLTRRIFLKNSGMAMIGIGALPHWLARTALASDVAGKRRKVLVALFQRGAADGLNVVIPYGEGYYYSVRPTIAIPRAEALDLDGFFALHPALAPLKPLWDQRQLAIVHAAGSPDPTRSHFDAQDYMESGTPGVKSTDDGWLNRTLAVTPDADRSPLRAVAMSAQLPRTLEGHAPALAIGNLAAFRLAGPAALANISGSTFAAMYEQAADAVLRPAGQDTFEALNVIKKLDAAPYQPVPGADYPRSPLGNGLRQLARLIKADVGVEVAFAEAGGWDHHVNEGNTQGQLAARLRDFAASIAAFWTDLGNCGQDVVLVTMSEFGRTVRENGNRGTDHGHANVMFVLGGPVRGGRVYGDWPGLDPEKLYQNRDLQVTTDFRDVLSEAVSRHLGVSSLAQVFPGFTADPARFRNYLGA